MTWTPPGFTLRQVRNVYSAATVDRHFGGDVPDTLGLILHVQDGNGGLFEWFDNPDSQASSAWWAGKNGEREQYGDPDTQRFWTQVAGNWTYHAVETEGTPDEPMTVAQVETVAQILAAGHERYGWPLHLAAMPGQRGLGWHGMGAPAWGHAYCPGEKRKAQMPAIVARAKAIAGEKEPRMAVSTNGWPIYDVAPGPTFTAPTGDTPDVATDDLAVLFADLATALHTEVARITKAWGGRSWREQQITNPGISWSNHRSYSACDMPMVGINGYGARTSGLSYAQERQVDRILARTGRIFEWGNDFIEPNGSTAYRDPVHFQIRQKYPYGAGPYPAVVSAADVRREATKVRQRWAAIQAVCGVTPDGVAGPGTLAAVEAFQKAHGLTVDGIVGPVTEAAMGIGGSVKPTVKPKPAPEQGPDLKVDGRFGKASVRALQSALGIKHPNGLLGGQSRRYKDILTGITGPAIGFPKRARGCATVKLLQRLVGVEDDGVLGPATVEATQRWLRDHGFPETPIDGVWGDGLSTRLQNALNRGRIK